MKGYDPQAGILNYRTELNRERIVTLVLEWTGYDTAQSI